MNSDSEEGYNSTEELLQKNSSSLRDLLVEYKILKCLDDTKDLRDTHWFIAEQLASEGNLEKALEVYNAWLQVKITAKKSSVVLDQLRKEQPTFQKLKIFSLSIAKNNLLAFPVSIFSIKELVNLSLSSNKIELVPNAISSLRNLKLLDLHNNKLKTLPEAMSKLVLSYLDVRENPLESLPAIQGKIIIADDQIKNLDDESQKRLKGKNKND
jgi:Leucine-rich repeat (LRR) protein